MIVDIIGIEMGGNDYLVVCAPHSFCRFYTDTVRFSGSDFICYKTLIPVISNIAAKFPIPPFGCHHTLVGSLLRTVNARHIHCLVGLLVILHVTERRPQVLVQELFIGGFIGVLRIVDNFL